MKTHVLVPELSFSLNHSSNSMVFMPQKDSKLSSLNFCFAQLPKKFHSPNLPQSPSLYLFPPQSVLPMQRGPNSEVLSVAYVRKDCLPVSRENDVHDASCNLLSLLPALSCTPGCSLKFPFAPQCLSPSTTSGRQATSLQTRVLSLALTCTSCTIVLVAITVTAVPKLI